MKESQKWVEWAEPFGPNEESVYCRVTEKTAIATQKRTAQIAKPGFVYENDDCALEDFITVHWATRIWITEPED